MESKESAANSRGWSRPAAARGEVGQGHIEAVTTLAEALALSVQCEHCGARMWPVEQLKLHMAIHELKKMVYDSQLAVVQRMFRRMRDSAGWG